MIFQKNSISGRAKFKNKKIIINILTKATKILPKKFRLYLFNLFRNKKGIVGIGVRYILLKTLAISIGDNVSVFPGVYLLHPDKLIIGNNVSIHPMCYIDAAGKISIGNDVSIAHGTTIMSSTHTYVNDNIPIKYQDIELKDVMIEDNVWIGAKVMILGGGRIKAGSIVGASSVVTKSVEKNMIVAGNPAKVIKKRI